MPEITLTPSQFREISRCQRANKLATDRIQQLEADAAQMQRRVEQLLEEAAQLTGVNDEEWAETIEGIADEHKTEVPDRFQLRREDGVARICWPDLQAQTTKEAPKAPASGKPEEAPAPAEEEDAKAPRAPASGKKAPTKKKAKARAKKKRGRSRKTA